MYVIMKSIHLLGVVLFLGNILAGIFWKRHGDRSRDPRLIAHTLDGIIRADRWLTVPGAALLLVFGFAAAGLERYPILRTGWIWQSLILFAISGFAFSAQLAPLQRRMRSLALASAGGEPWNQAEYDRLSRSWNLWGTIATVAPLAAMVLMIVKPAG